MTPYPGSFPVDSAEIILRYKDGTGTDSHQVVRNACWDLCGWSNGQKDALNPEDETLPPAHPPVAGPPTPQEVAAMPTVTPMVVKVPGGHHISDAELVGHLKTLVDNAKGVKKPAEAAESSKEPHAKEHAKVAHAKPSHAKAETALSLDWSSIAKALASLLLKLAE